MKSSGSPSSNADSPVLSLAPEGWFLTMVGTLGEGGGLVGPGGVLGFVLNLLTL